ncbi:hypothetical protein N7513_005641 [Penicillium frequentans]|nr:hypothetical protein N7513_005641 [Penicillium glabrum]
MLPDGVQGHGKTLHDPPPMPTAPQQEIELSMFDSTLHELSLDTVNAPAVFWSQEPYANTFDTRNQKTKTKEAQPAEHREVYPLRLTPFDTRSTQEQMWGTVSIGEVPEDGQGNARPGNEILKCQWKDCPYTGTFGRKADLMRHVETLHVSLEKKYKCSFTGCEKDYKRKDYLQRHLRKDHESSRAYR